jgi:hypothetical protein
MNAVRRKRPEKMENQQLVSPLQQCASTPITFGQGFLSKEQYDNIGASPYSPDLAPSDFYLFPQLKSAIKGQCFCDATDIIKNVMKELKRLPQNGFQERFKHMYSCWQKFVVAKEDYFEGTVA